MTARLPAFLQRWLRKRIARLVCWRMPDFIIGGAQAPYLLRWFVIPRNPVFNLYVHEFHRSDDDRALHDHPWINLSILVTGEYTEHTICAGGVHLRRVRREGDLVLRRSRHAHRIELHAGPCHTLFITGPRLRAWGFHCADAGWIHWKAFTRADDKGAIGRGCDQ
jgi:hypothetical protein